MPSLATRLPSAQSRAGIGAVICITLCMFVTMHTGWFTWEYFSSTPFWDFWDWLADYHAYLAGHYTVYDLVRPHNEHRILTTRLLLFIDAGLFHMTGHFVAVVNLLLLAATGLVLGSLAGGADAPWQNRAMSASATTAFMLSLCQWQNLILPFDVQIALMCAWIAVAASLLVKATVPASNFRMSVWAVLAGGSFTLAAFSMAGGLLSLPWLILLLILRRSAWRPACIFVAMAALSALLFLTHYHPVTAATILPSATPASLVRLSAFAFTFLGCAFYAFDGVPLVIGASGTICFLASLASVLHTCIRRRSLPSAHVTALLAIAGSFVLIACAAAATRAFFGLSGAMAPRYTTQSLVFCCATLLLTIAAISENVCRWRPCCSTAHAVRLSLLALAIITLNFAPRYTDDARAFSSNLVSQGVAMRNNVYVPRLFSQTYYGTRDRIAQITAQLKARHLATFAEKVTRDITPPSGETAPGAGTSAVCQGHIDLLYRLDETRTLLRGWFASANGRRTADWIELATPDDRPYAVLPASEYRGDVAHTLRKLPGAKGAYGGFANISATPREIKLRAFGIFNQAPKLACRMPGDLRLSPMFIQPLGSSGQVHPARLSASPSIGGAFKPDGGPGFLLRHAPDTTRHFLSTANAGDAATGTLTMEIRSAPTDDILIPYSTEPGATGQSADIILQDGQSAGMNLPEDGVETAWSVIRVPAAMLSDQPDQTARVTMTDAGTRWGEWLAVAPPLLAVPSPDRARLY